MKPTSKRYYAGIGSRETPQDIEDPIKEISDILNKKNYILRSGGAFGADSMFEKYAEQKEIYLPWLKFNENTSNLFLDLIDPIKVAEAKEIAVLHHPSWRSLSNAGKKLMTRNTFQILGLDLKSPVDFVICWAKGGKINHGTGQAMRIARSLKIPIFNLFNEESIYKIKIHISDEKFFC